MRTILVAFDGSQSARRALAFAIERGKEIPDSLLHVLIVHPEPRVTDLQTLCRELTFPFATATTEVST